MLVLGVVTGLEVCYFALWIGVGVHQCRTKRVEACSENLSAAVAMAPVFQNSA
jgi:hypothetical protein